MVGHGVALPPSLRPLSSVEADTRAEGSLAVVSTRLESAREGPVSTECTIVWGKCISLIVTSVLRTFLPSMAKLVYVTVSRIEISKTIAVVHLAVRVVVTEDEKLGMVMGLHISFIEHLIQLSDVGSARRY